MIVWDNFEVAAGRAELGLAINRQAPDQVELMKPPHPGRCPGLSNLSLSGSEPIGVFPT